MISYSGIQHEDRVTFEHEFSLLLRVYPEMEERHFVLILDGDQAKWAAARSKFQNVTLILCIYHSRENFKKRFGPLCRISKIPPSSNSANFKQVDEKTSLWIQCDLCDKWRRVPSHIGNPVAFVCADNIGCEEFSNCLQAEEVCEIEEVDSNLAGVHFKKLFRSI